MKQKIDKQCAEIITHKSILLDDKETKSQSKMYLLNADEKEVIKVQIDGCYDDFEGERCDWLAIVKDKDEKNNAVGIGHFVELKGSNVKKACEQLENSIEKVVKSEMTKVKFAFAITSKVAPATNTIIQNHKERFAKKGIKLEVKNSGYQFKI